MAGTEAVAAVVTMKAAARVAAVVVVVKARVDVMTLFSPLHS